MASRFEVLAFLGSLARLFGHGPEAEEDYVAALADLDGRWFGAAAAALKRDCRFFPLPAEIREAVVAGESAAEPDPEWPRSMVRVWGPRPIGPRLRAEWFARMGYFSPPAVPAPVRIAAAAGQQQRALPPPETPDDPAEA